MVGDNYLDNNDTDDNDDNYCISEWIMWQWRLRLKFTEREDYEKRWCWEGLCRKCC